jgi:hypothetical protein
MGCRYALELDVAWMPKYKRSRLPELPCRLSTHRQRKVWPFQDSTTLLHLASKAIDARFDLRGSLGFAIQRYRAYKHRHCRPVVWASVTESALLPPALQGMRMAHSGNLLLDAISGADYLLPHGPLRPVELRAKLILFEAGGAKRCSDCAKPYRPPHLIGLIRSPI